MFGMSLGQMGLVNTSSGQQFPPNYDGQSLDLIFVDMDESYATGASLDLRLDSDRYFEWAPPAEPQGSYWVWVGYAPWEPSLNLDFVNQIGVQYAVLATPPSVNYGLMPIALLNAASNMEPEKTLFQDTLIGGRPLGDINNSGTVTSADSLAYSRFNGSFWLNAAGFDDYIRNVLNPYMIANPVTYSAYLLF